MWWHGFVLAYFSCCSDPVYLRRLRCPGCGAVHRLKPTGYFPRFRSSIREIQESIAHRCRRGRWRPDLPRSRQRQWWHRLGRMITLMLGISFSGTFLHGFDLLMHNNVSGGVKMREKDGLKMQVKNRKKACPGYGDRAGRFSIVQPAPSS